MTGVTHDDDADPKFTYEYDAKGRAAVVTDTRDGSTIRNIYDLTARRRVNSGTETETSSIVL